MPAPSVADRVAKRREVAREVVGEQLVDPLRAGGLRADDSPRSRDGDRRRGRPVVCAESEDLAAVPGVGDARRADDVDARVALLAERRRAGVEPDAHPDLGPPGHASSRSARCVASSRGGAAGALGERGDELVSDRVDLVPSFAVTALAQQARTERRSRSR